jgi:IclR family KDG regulon transcriptional repressor
MKFNTLVKAVEIFDQKTLLRDLRKIRRCGCALSDQEFDLGAKGVAAPIPYHEGGAIASICVIGPSNRMNKNNLVMATKGVIKCAQAISKKVDYRPTGRENRI